MVLGGMLQRKGDIMRRRTFSCDLILIWSCETPHQLSVMCGGLNASCSRLMGSEKLEKTASVSGPSFVLSQKAADEVRDCHKMQSFAYSLADPGAAWTDTIQSVLCEG